MKEDESMEALRRDVRRGQRRRLKIWLAVLVGLAVVVIAVVKSGVFEKPVPQRDYKEGCPCGCDRSAHMADELRGRPKPAALAAIDKSLATIAEREDAGYITERMLSHRLRLLDLARELDAPRSSPDPARSSSWNLTFAETAAVRVGVQLITHAETTELVDGREKLLRACFLLRMDIENMRGAAQTLEPPVIASDVPFPIGRWYVEHGNGEPWNGVLEAGARKRVHVVGYLGEPVQAGSAIAATVRFASATIAVRARARSHWSDPD